MGLMNSTTAGLNIESRSKTKDPVAAMSSLWFRKNATQRFTGSGSFGSQGIYHHGLTMYPF